jgi:hypothetical protein
LHPEGNLESFDGGWFQGLFEDFLLLATLFGIELGKRFKDPRIQSYKERFLVSAAEPDCRFASPILVASFFSHKELLPTQEREEIHFRISRKFYFLTISLEALAFFGAEFEYRFSSSSRQFRHFE